MESPGQKTLAQKTFWITLWIKIISSVPNMFLSSSQWVPSKFLGFPMCSPKVFQLAPHFNPICFAQSPPLLTYIGEPKGKASHLSIESFILSSLHSLNFYLFVCERPTNSTFLVSKVANMHLFVDKSQISSLPSFVLNDKFPDTVELFLYIRISITILMMILK